MIGKRIRELREGKGWTTRDLANRLNKAESTIRMWELDKREPSIATLKQLSCYLDVSVDFIVGNSMENKELETAYRLIKLQDAEIGRLRAEIEEEKIRRVAAEECTAEIEKQVSEIKNARKALIDAIESMLINVGAALEIPLENFVR